MSVTRAPPGMPPEVANAFGKPERTIITLRRGSLAADRCAQWLGITPTTPLLLVKAAGRGHESAGIGRALWDVSPDGKVYWHQVALADMTPLQGVYWLFQVPDAVLQTPLIDKATAPVRAAKPKPGKHPGVE